MTEQPVKYVITQLVLGADGEIELSKHEYDKIRASKDGMSRVLDIEERLEALLGNFEEFELEVLRIANHNMIYIELTWDGMQSTRNLLGRRLLNFLASVRAYFDQTDRDLKHAYGRDAATCSGYEAARHAAYDRSLSFRVMEHLRNHAQHCEAVVHRLSYPSTRDQKSGVVTHTVDLSIDIDALERAGKFKKRVIDELRKSGESAVSLRDLVRDYVEEIGAIHEELRRLLAAEVEEWGALERDCIDRFVRSFGAETVGLAAAAIRLRGEHEDGVLEERHLNGNVNGRRAALASKNRKILNCRSRRVASGPR